MKIVCEGYHDQHQVIEWFWGVVEHYNKCEILCVKVITTSTR